MRDPRLSGFESLPPPRATRILLRWVVLPVILVAALAAGGFWWLTHGGWKRLQPLIERDGVPGPSWLNGSIQYPQEPTPTPAAAPARDHMSELLAKLMAELTQLRAEIEALKRVPRTTVATPPPPPQPAAGQPKPKHGHMLFVSHDVKAPEAPPPHTYTLTPGATKIPCIVETVTNSDVEGYFTAKVRNNIHDSATFRHLLIPQNSTILGDYQSHQLLFGNERLPTVSLTLSLADGRVVDLGKAPVTDQKGIAGLTGDINDHWVRAAFGAIFLGGARGVAQAIQAEAAGGGPAGQVASGIAQTGNQAVQLREGRNIDTRPTITVASGSLCTVLLTKPLTLQAIGE
jgi:type IV secretory pathway VirB10-like protein